MAKLRQSDWALLKRLCRYLIGAPRLVQLFRWQELPKSVHVFADSDWAGCQGTCRSTSGGVANSGTHTLKTWSGIQATVAFRSAEAELYAATIECGGTVPWPAIDRAHDEYFDAYWKLRAEIAGALDVPISPIRPPQGKP